MPLQQERPDWTEETKALSEAWWNYWNYQGTPDRDFIQNWWLDRIASLTEAHKVEMEKMVVEILNLGNDPMYGDDRMVDKEEIKASEGKMNPFCEPYVDSIFYRSIGQMKLKPKKVKQEQEKTDEDENDEEDEEDEYEEDEEEEQIVDGLDHSQMPGGVTSTTAKWIRLGEQIELSVSSGFIGFFVVETDQGHGGALRPEVGWWIGKVRLPAPTKYQLQDV